MKATGRVVAKCDVISGESSNGQPWSKQTVVVEYNAEYHKQAAIEFFGEDKVKKLEQVKVGDMVTAEFSVESHSYGEKWYTTLKGYELATYTPQ